jgi:hypothetical protein
MTNELLQLDADTVGFRVVTQEGHSLGFVEEIKNEHVKVRSPLTRDYWLSFRYIGSVGNRQVTLSIASGEVDACKRPRPRS